MRQNASRIFPRPKPSRQSGHAKTSGSGAVQEDWWESGKLLEYALLPQHAANWCWAAWFQLASSVSVCFSPLNYSWRDSAMKLGPSWSWNIWKIRFVGDVFGKYWPLTSQLTDDGRAGRRSKWSFGEKKLRCFTCVWKACGTCSWERRS